MSNNQTLGNCLCRPLPQFSPPLRELNPNTDAAFRFACGDIKLLTRRIDKPHIWFHDGYWRVSLMAGRTSAGRPKWEIAYQLVMVLNHYKELGAYGALQKAQTT